MTDTQPPEKPTVHELWGRVMAGVGGVAKRDINRDQGFPFRGIDAVLNAVGPVLREHGVFVVPSTVEVIDDYRYESRKGASMQRITVRVTWTVYGPAGDSFQGVTLGQAADSGDKVVTKAQTVAWRVFLIQALSIPTDEPDPDLHTHELETSQPDPMIEARQAAYAAAGRHVPQGLPAEEDHQARLSLIVDALAAQDATVETATVDQVRAAARFLTTGEVAAPAQPENDVARPQTHDGPGF